MRILYFTTFELPSHRANRTHVVKMCEAFSDFAKVTLVVNKVKGDIKERYNLKKTPEIVEVCYSGHLKSLVYAWKLRSILKKTQPDYLFVRDHYLLLCLNILRCLHLLETPKMILGVHWVYDFNFFTRMIDSFNIPRVDFYVFLTEYIAYYYTKRFKLDYHRVLALPNGVDLTRFCVDASKEELRRKLDLPLHKKIIGWNGTSFKEQGVDEGPFSIIRALQFVDAKDYLICFVGGSEGEIKEASVLVQKLGVGDYVKFIGLVDYMKIPLYFRTFDAALLCFNWTEHYAYHMCPRKLLDYLASCIPIIASELPCLKIMLNQKNSFFYLPGDDRDLADKIDYVLTHEDEAQEKASQAFKDVRAYYTWHRRAEKIIKLLKQ